MVGSPWRFYSNGRGTFLVTADAVDGAAAALVEMDAVGGNVQLYQSGLTLEPHTHYQLRFDAKSSRGQDMRLYVHKHGAPYTNYGVRGAVVDLTSAYQSFVWEFTTGRFDTPVDDGRLRFWFAPYARAGDSYTIDNVVLRKVGATATSAASNVTLVDDEADLLAGGDVGEENAVEIFLPVVTR
ncbi:MAG: carbohydrate binding domain-containing protein [Caldilineaceae bacterium]|nr:carbohydrate binding domain-containing protein [Caldilineaceae bacterium]